MKPSTKVKDFEMSASCRSCGLEQTRKPDGKIVEGVQKPVEQVFAMVLSKEDCNYCRGEEGEMALFKQLQMAGKLKDVGKLSVPELGRRRRVRRERRVDDAVEKEHVKAEYVQKEVEKKESLIGWTIKRKSIMKNSIQIGSIKEESYEKNFVFEKDSVPRINPSDSGHAFVVAF